MSIACPECFEAPDDDTRICPAHGLYGVDVSELVHLEKAPYLGLIVDGRYALVGRVGEGGMGTVYRARQLAVGRDVAFKVQQGTGLADPVAQARFHSEARVIAALESDHTVPLYDFGRVRSGRLAGATFMVMQLVKGISLAQRLARGRMPLSEICLVLDHVADSLDEAHARGIVHRDLKPSNLLLTGNRGRPRVKVIDFGIARIQDIEQTAENTALGTPGYMAPEMWRRREDTPLDGRVDVYAMGIVLYQMLTGRKPCGATELLAIARWHIEGEIPSLAEHAAELAQLDPVVACALARDPRARYATVGQMAADFRGHVAELLGSPIVDRFSFPSSSGVEPTPSAISGSLEVSRPVTGNTSRHMSGAIAERPEPGRHQERRRRGRLLSALAVGIGVGGALWFGLRAEPPATRREPTGPRLDVQRVAVRGDLGVRAGVLTDAQVSVPVDQGPSAATGLGAGDATTLDPDGGARDAVPDARPSPPEVALADEPPRPQPPEPRVGKAPDRPPAKKSARPPRPKPPVAVGGGVAADPAPGSVAPAEPPSLEPWRALLDEANAALSAGRCGEVRRLKARLESATGAARPPEPKLAAFKRRYVTDSTCEEDL